MEIFSATSSQAIALGSALLAGPVQVVTAHVLLELMEMTAQSFAGSAKMMLAAVMSLRKQIL